MTGNPKGSRYVFISNRICMMYVIARSELSLVNGIERLKYPSFYILLGQDEDQNPMAYIGQTEDFTERVKQHDYKKSFWNRALIFTSIGNDMQSMTKADVEFLEYKGYKLAKEINRYSLSENKQEPKEPHLPKHQRDAMNEYFEDCKSLVAFIGCNLFEEGKKEHKKGQITFYLTRVGCNAIGVYSAEGMTVLRDSHVMKDCAPSYKNVERRNEWLKNNSYVKDGEFYLKADCSFESPSAASSFCLGRSSNGWKDWKTQDNNDLDSIYRHSLDDGVKGNLISSD